MATTTPALSLSQVRALAASGEARQLRHAARLSLSEMASLVGVNPSTIWRWEEGERRPRGDAAVRYAAALETLDRLARR